MRFGYYIMDEQKIGCLSHKLKKGVKNDRIKNTKSHDSQSVLQSEPRFFNGQHTKHIVL